VGSTFPAGSSSSAMGAKRLAPPARYGFPGSFGKFSGELKKFDTVQAFTNVASAGSVTSIFQPTQGSDYTNRIGRKTTAVTLQMRARSSLSWADAIAGASQDVYSEAQQQRVMLLYDLQPNGSAAAVTQILDTATIVSQRNLDWRDRFICLMDKTIDFDPAVFQTSAGSSVTQLHTNRATAYWSFYRRIKLDTIFQANAGAIGDIASGAFLLLLLSSSAAGDSGNGITYTTRLRFEDA